jgi:hypothetical protein
MPRATAANVTFWFQGLMRLRDFVRGHLGVPVPDTLHQFAEMTCDSVFGDDTIGKRDVTEFLFRNAIGIATADSFKKAKVRDFMDDIMPPLQVRMTTFYHEVACDHRKDLIAVDPVLVLPIKLGDLYPTVEAQEVFSKETLEVLEPSFAEGKDPVADLAVPAKASIAEMIK